MYTYEISYLFIRLAKSITFDLCIKLTQSSLFVPQKMPFQTKAQLPVLYIGRIAPAEITFGKAEIMNGIQQVGFAGAIPSADTHNSLLKIVVLVIVILKLI